MLNVSDLLSHGAHGAIASSASSASPITSSAIYQQELAKLVAKSRGTAYEATLRRFMEQRMQEEPTIPAPAQVNPAPVHTTAPAPLSKAALLSAMTRGAAPRAKQQQQQQHVSALSTPLERHRWSGPEREINSSLCVPRTSTNHLGRQRPAASDERAPQTCVIVNTTHLPEPLRGSDALGTRRKVTSAGFQSWLDSRRRPSTEAEEAARARAGMDAWLGAGDDYGLAGESLVDSLDFPRPPAVPQVFARLAGHTPPLGARARFAARLAEAHRDLTFTPRIDAHSRELADAVRRQQQEQQQQQHHVLSSQHLHLPPRPRSASPSVRYDPDHWSRRSSSPAPSSPRHSARGRSPFPLHSTPRGFGSSSPRRCSMPSSDQVIRVAEDRGYSPALARAALSGARHASPGERARAAKLPPPPPRSSFYGRPRRGSSVASSSPQRSPSPSTTRVRRESTGDVPVFTNRRSEEIMAGQGEQRNFFDRMASSVEDFHFRRAVADRLVKEHCGSPGVGQYDVGAALDRLHRAGGGSRSRAASPAGGRVAGSASPGRQGFSFSRERRDSTKNFGFSPTHASRAGLGVVKLSRQESPF